MLSAGFVDKIGYRASIILAHVCAAAGLLSLTILPELLPNAYSGILIAVAIYAVGGGLIEVLISPILEACPTDNKDSHEFASLLLLLGAYGRGTAFPQCSLPCAALITGRS